MLNLSEIRIDLETCIGCGLCSEICGRGCIVEKSGTVEISDGQECSRCGQCIAICPSGSISPLFAPAEDFFALEQQEPVTHNQFYEFLYSRRSHRCFSKKEVSKDTLQSLADICRSAPTGSNERTLEILFITNPEKISDLSKTCVEYFKKQHAEINQKIKKMISSKKMFSTEFIFLKKRAPKIKKLVDSWEDGRDPVFRSAPVIMIFHSTPYTSTPKDNCVIAAHTVALYARTLNIETCYIGLLEKAFWGSKAVRDALSLPGDNKLYSVLILGYPKYRFLRAVRRPPIPVKWA